MDIDVLAKRYGGMSARVVARAGEYMRLTAARKSAAVDMATPAACLLVAAKSFDETLDARKLSSLAGVNQRLVNQAMHKILGAVDVRSVVQFSPAQLCVRFGCEAITELVNRVFVEYQVIAERMSRGKGKDRVFDHDSPVFAAACVFASSKHANLRVDKVKLLNLVCGNPKAFEAIVTSIETHCKASLSGAILSRRRRGATSGTPSKASAAELADAADASELERVRDQDQRGPGSQNGNSNITPLKPNKALRRLYERPQDSIHESQVSSRPTTPIKTRANGVTDHEYAEWRANALAHMRGMLSPVWQFTDYDLVAQGLRMGAARVRRERPSHSSGFMHRYAALLPRTTLQYATEHLDRKLTKPQSSQGMLTSLQKRRTVMLHLLRNELLNLQLKNTSPKDLSSRRPNAM